MATLLPDTYYVAQRHHNGGHHVLNAKVRDVASSRHMAYESCESCVIRGVAWLQVAVHETAALLHRSSAS